MANFLNIAPKGAAQKCSNVNVFFVFENGQFPRHRPQEVMQYLTYFSDVLLKRMAREARKMFQYITHLYYGFLKKKRARSEEIF